MEINVNAFLRHALLAMYMSCANPQGGWTRGPDPLDFPGYGLLKGKMFGTLL